jgi:hypothetical protein
LGGGGTSGIQLKKESTIKTVLYADDQILIAKSEDDLQMAAHRLGNIAKEYLRISASKIKSMGKCGNEIRRLKIMIDGKIIDQVTEFNYVGSKISEYKKDMEYKLQTYNRINGVIKRNFGKKMSNQTKLIIHNITAKTTLKYGSETWVLNRRDKQRLGVAQHR